MGGLVPGSRACTEQELADVKRLFNVNFVDLVEIPHDLPAGDYVLSWRHDSEQTAQVWATCADITVTAHSTASSALVWSVCCMVSCLTPFVVVALSRFYDF